MNVRSDRRDKRSWGFAVFFPRKDATTGCGRIPWLLPKPKPDTLATAARAFPSRRPFFALIRGLEKLKKVPSRRQACRRCCGKSWDQPWDGLVLPWARVALPSLMAKWLNPGDSRAGDGQASCLANSPRGRLGEDMAAQGTRKITVLTSVAIQVGVKRARTDLSSRSPRAAAPDSVCLIGKDCQDRQVATAMVPLHAIAARPSSPACSRGLNDTR